MISNKANMSIVATLFNIVLEVQGMAIQEEKEIKGIQIGKEVKLSLEMTGECTQKILRCYQKTLHLAWRAPWAQGPGGLQSTGLQRSRHNEVTGHTSMHTEYGINTWKSSAFLYTDKERAEIEIKETIPYTISSKRIPRNKST